MGYEYADKKQDSPGKAPKIPAQPGMTAENVPNSARLAALESGAINPSAADKGHQVDLPEAMRAKMENAFGMNFARVKLYESQRVAEAGAEAVARGSEVAFAPGKLDLSSQSGQALLGHELSHVASQARGNVRGSGFLMNSGLEAQADREGAMAARGETIYSGIGSTAYGGAAAPLSAASAAPMTGPMQAKGKEKKSPEQKKMEEMSKLREKEVSGKGWSEKDYKKYTNYLNSLYMGEMDRKENRILYKKGYGEYQDESNQYDALRNASKGDKNGPMAQLYGDYQMMRSRNFVENRMDDEDNLGSDEEIDMMDAHKENLNKNWGGSIFKKWINKDARKRGKYDVDMDAINGKKRKKELDEVEVYD